MIQLHCVSGALNFESYAIAWFGGGLRCLIAYTY